MAFKSNIAATAKAEGETLGQEKAEVKALKSAPKSTTKPGQKKLCPTCNRQMSCPHMK